MSRIGLIYFFLPNRMLLAKNSHKNESHINQKDKKSLYRNVFKLNHYYSLLMLAKTFKISAQNRMLFYFLDDNFNRPVNTHYNQWLNDTFWNCKIPIEGVKFIPYGNHKSGENLKYNLYEIMNHIKHDSLNKFDDPNQKDRFLFVTSDIIIGPRINHCFSYDSTVPSKSHYNSYDVEELKNKMSNECFDIFHDNFLNKHYFSLLYQLEYFHTPNDFSGIILWNKKFARKNSLKIDSSMIHPDNVYYCQYKSDVIEQNKHNYEDSFCVFGFELNLHESPVLERIFFDEKRTKFNQNLREIFYGDSKPFKHNILSAPKIPNIVHLIWFGDEYKSLKFIEYLSIKSILNVLKPDKLKIHGDNQPRSEELWNELARDPRTEWVHMQRPLIRYSQNLTESPIQHIADIARLEVMYNEGGIYSDMDIIWVRPLDKYRYYDVELVASNDITSYCNEFPNSIQIGAFLAPPRSNFIKKWLKGYEKYHYFPGDYVAISMCEPYKVYEKNPSKVLIDNRLQMIYFNGWSVFIPR
jgi:hypothetical protein